MYLFFHLKNYLLLGLFSIITVALTHAQITSAAVSGKVMNLKNETLLGASVIATHEPTGTMYRVVCDENGVFQIENMNTGGPYLVKTSMVGFEDETQNNVFLTLGNTTKVDFSTKGIVYDENGNLQSMTNMGIVPGATAPDRKSVV